MEQVHECKNCIHSKYDDIWGEYKCMKLGRYVKNNKPDCVYFRKKPVKKNKNVE